MRVVLVILAVLALLGCEFDVYRGSGSPAYTIVGAIENECEISDGLYDISIESRVDLDIYISNATIGGLSELHIVAPFDGWFILDTPSSGESFSVDINGDIKTFEVI